MKRIYSAANLQEAHLISHRLNEAGIEHHIFNEGIQGGVGELPFTHSYPDIWLVDMADTDRAMEIIRSFEKPVEPGPAVRCRSCGEENPSTFEICWQCGAGLK